MDDNARREAKRVNHNVFLAPLDLLVAVDATVGCDVMGGPYASGAYDSHAWRVLPSRLPPDDDMEGVRKLLEHTLPLPLSEVVEHGVVGREVLGEHPPLAACLHNVHDRVQDLPELVFSLSLLRTHDILVICHCLSVRLVEY